MSSAARSIRWFGLYLCLLGPTLVLVPNLFLSTFGLPPTQEVWIRVVGLLVLIIGIFQRVAAANEAVWFFRTSIVLRTLVLVTFGTFVLLGLARPVLALFGLVDLAGAVWTAAALRADRRAPAKVAAA